MNSFLLIILSKPVFHHVFYINVTMKIIQKYLDFGQVLYE